jgi:hypothetical protein
MIDGIPARRERRGALWWGEHWKDDQRWSAKCDFSHIWPRPDRSNLRALQKGKGNQPGHEGLIDTI